MEWISQFDILSHVSYAPAALSDLTADVATVVSSQALALTDTAPSTADWTQTQALVAAGAGAVVAGAASYLGFEIASSAAALDDRMLAKQVLKMVYQRASWCSVAEAAYLP